jgi:hypothetical protein
MALSYGNLLLSLFVLFLKILDSTSKGELIYSSLRKSEIKIISFDMYLYRNSRVEPRSPYP